MSSLLNNEFKSRPRVLVIGAGFSGFVCARDLRRSFRVTCVDAKEFFEYTPGILRAYVHPEHFNHLTFTLKHALENNLGVKYMWGEVTELDGAGMRARVKPMFADEEIIEFDYCVISAGCNFNPLHKYGESLWFPTVHAVARPHSDWKHLDERYIEGRRRHILEEYGVLKDLNERSATVLVVGAGFIGVEWVTELQHYFPKLKLFIIDFLNKCLGPLPDSAAGYCDKYMSRKGIKATYGVKYDPNNWKEYGMSSPPDKTYVCIGVKASNYFMPEEVLSDKGPGGGKWIHVNKCLQVVTKDRKIWADGSIFAVGDCNQTFADEIKPIPKISYPGEEQATHVCKSIKFMEGKTGCCGMFMKPREAIDSWWPWGAGMFATSLGPHDACFVMAAKSEPRTGLLTLWGWASAIQKEIIESSKVDECKGGRMGQLIWHWVHHTPCHCWGDGCSRNCCTSCTWPEWCCDWECCRCC
mmetsp:Transcript_79042/g.211220  ORF Transcript_79042/g.211220 Transcript_79042/m.211220 type:complete len:469 (-) Transcript_79042:157-1563(-)